tara:strand:+ start:127 stop:288 length:162 start_codon:yes stop_codon:yes gene_type:complete
VKSSLREACEKLNLEIGVRHFPGNRAIADANNGVLDGKIVPSGGFWKNTQICG